MGRSGYVETEKWMAFARRIIRRAGVRVGDADEVELGLLIELRGELDESIAVAIAGQRARGVSWARIAEATGTSRQGAQQRWGR